MRMTKLESILREARLLPPEELAGLLAALLEQSTRDSEVEETLAGQRGLAAWTESARREDWSEFYPDSLRNGRGSST
ncbi:MAG: hypothetical protein KAV82_13245 [Phycisphaerae bacterium]|nr:hypothetical protein [Phycisphaerae bacterium]